MGWGSTEHRFHFLLHPRKDCPPLVPSQGPRPGRVPHTYSLRPGQLARASPAHRAPSSLPCPPQARLADTHEAYGPQLFSRPSTPSLGVQLGIGSWADTHPGPARCATSQARSTGWHQRGPRALRVIHKHPTQKPPGLDGHLRMFPAAASSPNRVFALQPGSHWPLCAEVREAPERGSLQTGRWQV